MVVRRIIPPPFGGGRDLLLMTISKPNQVVE
jgi:hypothetical protein